LPLVKASIWGLKCESNVAYVKKSKRVSTLKFKVSTIPPRSSFGRTFKKITASKNISFVWLAKPKINQMTAVLLLKISGRKFFWVQNYKNPPVPNFFARLLISQADRIMVKDKKEKDQLKSFGIEKSKIKIERK